MAVEAKVGDRVSLDAKKVGQPRRAGVVTDVSQGLSGTRYRVKWDDGQESMLSPSYGNLTIDGKTGKTAGRKAGAKPVAKVKKAVAKRGRR